MARRRGEARDLPTLRSRLAWAYANLARAHRAVEDGATRYGTLHHVIRARLFAGLRDGTMAMGSLYDDERVKLTAPPGCVYCGADGPLSLDHLIPRLRGGADAADNLVPACRSCNSAKGARDMLVWLAAGGRFPGLMLLRRHLKLAARAGEAVGALDLAMADPRVAGLPFDAAALPTAFPQPAGLSMHRPTPLAEAP